MQNGLSLLASVILCLATVKWVKSKFLVSSRLPYPPGPPPKSWLLGNLADIPFESPWLILTQWSRKYGGLMYVRMMNKHNIVVNSLDVAKEIFDRRSNIYSDRPNAPISDLMGWQFSTAFAPYGDTWRAQRRLFQQSYKPEAARNYEGIQTQKVNDLLYGLLNTPDDFFSHIRHESGAIIMSAVYGHDVQPKRDHYVDIAEEALDNLAKAVMYPVNAIPILRYLPEWMPGGGFQRVARETKVLTSKMLNEPLDMVKEQVRHGTARPCLAIDLLESCSSEEDIYHAKCVCATSYAAGADTSVSSVETFFHAMARFPEIQKKAQEEIDRIVGSDRLPAFKDRPLMPYSEALYREVLRWRPALPIGVFRSTTEEDVYEGYYIPKGATVISNIWAMTRDPAHYSDPESFEPSRFFSENGELNSDDVHYVFGFGRRICPGRYLASATVWLSIVTVLACFNINKKKDLEGKEIPIGTEYSGGVLIHPLPFQCSIVPRSDMAKALITDAIAQKD